MPFDIFRPYSSEIDIHLFSKADNIQADDDLTKALHVDRIASLWQMHGSTALVVREPSSRTMQADGLMTHESDLTISIRAADCQIFVVYVPEQKVAGLMHVGWRGLTAGMIPAFFQRLQDEYGIRPESCVIGAGPSLCKHCAEFTEPMRELPGIPEKFVDGRHADLQMYATYQLITIGMDPEKFERHPDCTKCSSDKWWSYRGGDREKVLEGWANVLSARIMK
jgi:copper oxidase (laccase) domain-containing protein